MRHTRRARLYHTLVNGMIKRYLHNDNRSPENHTPAIKKVFYDKALTNNKADIGPSPNLFKHGGSKAKNLESQVKQLRGRARAAWQFFTVHRHFCSHDAATPRASK